ncbi:hypothetical protein B0H16DRAFT_1528394 [Mycena metata]|uniref:MYND-type domain-containing protein n=1 Tax=Mycena metata TaxID=1033252 RepID=A0AAD7JEY8_9AGAR|nr:hypothetical protein B0H16DRAFT_1528394 [Mycena metata]
MSITNVKTVHIPGFDIPATTYEINFDDDKEAQEEPEPTKNDSPSGGGRSFANVQILNAAGDGYGPHATTLGDIANKIPSKPSLKKSCEKCGKRPDQDGTGFASCAGCKIARYCSRECQTSHWKYHKGLCQLRKKHAELERELEAKALANNGPFVSQAALRKWYQDNVDIVDYAVVQTLELYKGCAHDLWRTNAVVFSLTGGKLGTSVPASDIRFSDAEAAEFTTLARRDRLGLPPNYLAALGAGSRVIVVFLLNREMNLMLVEGHDLPADEEWAGMEKDDMWRMHIRMRDMAQMLG